jgi:starch synthase
LKILFVAAESAPVVKVGGLADVVGSLPKALIRLGHDVRVILPRYGVIDISGSKAVVDNSYVEMQGKENIFTLQVANGFGDIVFYLIDNPQFSRSGGVYDADELKRFLMFDKVTVRLLPELSWQPDIIHCHDWHTALVPMWLKEAGWKGVTVFTIHNLAYQGFFDNRFLITYDLAKYWQYKHHCFDELPLNFLCQGIMWADTVTTVSENYAREIVLPEHGMGLDCLLRDRKDKFKGIINGIDYEVYNPDTDRYISATFNESNLERRTINKTALQKIVGFQAEERLPVMGMVSRLDEQKGFDLIVNSLPYLIENTGAQMVVLGRGQDHYQSLLLELAGKYPDRLAVLTNFNEALAHLIYAGCDMFLMPSLFEPCGLGQLIAMRYGAVPIVRHTGGLVDTVTDLSDDLSTGTGFVFRDYNSQSMIGAIQRAINSYIENKGGWQQVMQRIMSQDFSWQNSARKYDALYQDIVGSRNHD